MPSYSTCSYTNGPSVTYTPGHWNGGNSVLVVTPTRHPVLRKLVKARGHQSVVTGTHLMCKCQQDIHRRPPSMTFYLDLRIDECQ